MRYAILSDVHANLQAFNAVLTDIFSLGVDQILCLGDVVGYGPNPAEVLESAHARVKHFVLGNHDAVIAGVLSPALFNDRARRMIEWSAGELDTKACGFLRQLPYALTDPVFRCTHGNPACPGAFGYVLEGAQAQQAWERCPEQILFVGHSHVPGLYVLGHSGTAHWLNPTDFAAEAHKRYIVNVGSVGEPRNGDVRASYCLFDLERREVRFRQVPFDLEGYRLALAESGAPVRSSLFLRMAADGKPPPLREMLDFHPVERRARTRERGRETQLGEAMHSASRWRMGALGLSVLLLAVAMVGWRLRSTAVSGGTTYPAASRAVMPLPAVGASCLPEARREGPVGAARPSEHYTVWLAEPRAQRVEIVRKNVAGPPVWRLASDVPSGLALESPAVAAAQGMRFKVSVRGRRNGAFEGYAAMTLVEECTDGTRRLILHYPLERLRDDRWRYFHKSTPGEGLPADGVVRWVLQGEFRGVLELHSCQIERIR